MPTPDTVVLSTGHEVALPLDTRARMDAVAVGADATGVRSWLPDGLAPVRYRPGRATVVFVAVSYDRVGDHALPPYDEFGVFLAATPAEKTGAVTRSIPELGALRRGIGGYTVALPVTTESARALGVEVWGYPKTVAEVSVHEGCRRRTTVGDADGRLATVEVSTRPWVPFSARTATFTAPGSDTATGSENRTGDLRRQPLELSGRVGARPLTGGVSLGDHPLAERLADLDPGRALLSVSFSGTFRIFPNERLPP